jgi:hypothetical protein
MDKTIANATAGFTSRVLIVILLQLSASAAILTAVYGARRMRII